MSEQIIFNPGNIEVAKVTEDGLVISEDKILRVDSIVFANNSRIRDAGESLVLFDRTVGGISLEEIANIAQGNSSGEWTPKLLVNEKEASAEIKDNRYTKIGSLCFVNASIKYMGITVENPGITISGLPFISSHNAEISGLSGSIIKNIDKIEIRSVPMINNGKMLSFSATYII